MRSLFVADITGLILIKKNNWLIASLLFGSILTSWNNPVWGVPNNVNRDRVQLSQSNVDTDTLKALIKKRSAAAKEENWEAVLRLMSPASRSQLLEGLFFLAMLRAPDNDYRQETESLKAKIDELERTTGFAGEDIGEASLAVQALYYEALRDSLKKQFDKLENLDRFEGEDRQEEYELKIISAKNNTAIAALIRHNSQNSAAIFIKQQGQWLFATQEEVEAARLPKGSLHYVSPGLLPLAEVVPFLSDKEQYTGSAPDWYKNLPATTAKRKGIEVGDIVLAFVEDLVPGLSNFRVISIERDVNGDSATLIRQDNKIFENMPLALLHKVEDYIDRFSKLKIQDAVYINQWGVSIFARVSRITGSQIHVKYVFMDEVKEKVPQGIIVPIPKDGYLFRKVLYRHEEKTDLGMVIAESETKVWIDTASGSLGVIAKDKTDIELIELPDADLRVRKVWFNTYNSIRQAPIARIMEPGLLYEIEVNDYGRQFDLLPFDEILLQKPSSIYYE